MKRRLVACLLLAALAGAARSAAGGPVEAERLYKEAAGVRQGPWPRAVRAYRRVLHEAGRADPHRARAHRALASVFTDAGLPHAALAARAAALAASHPALDPPPFRLAYARALLREGDEEAAHGLLEALATMDRHRGPRQVAAALGLLAERAYEAGDIHSLARLARRLEEVRAPAPERMETWGRLGLLHLSTDDRPQAEACLAAARGVYEEAREGAATGSEGKELRRVIRLWLDLPLREALER